MPDTNLNPEEAVTSLAVHDKSVELAPKPPSATAPATATDPFAKTATLCDLPVHMSTTLLSSFVAEHSEHRPVPWGQLKLTPNALHFQSLVSPLP